MFSIAKIFGRRNHNGKTIRNGYLDNSYRQNLIREAGECLRSK